MRAGQLRERVLFQTRLPDQDDGYGNVIEGSWTDEFAVAARIQFLRGTESVMAARLEGREPVIITVRRSSQTEQITPDWRAVDARNPDRIFNIRGVSPDEKHTVFDILADGGVAT
ncbi:head-tail adaptor protein [Rhodoligotrophos ferricapiens]|uniref:head-tail adaptor protein n=1 Tax=Rhodoligotrophos ferricapiens TaxID=3069264 RepID=UPI00315CC4A0